MKKKPSFKVVAIALANLNGGLGIIPAHADYQGYWQDAVEQYSTVAINNHDPDVEQDPVWITTKLANTTIVSALSGGIGNGVIPYYGANTNTAPKPITQDSLLPSPPAYYE